MPKSVLTTEKIQFILDNRLKMSGKDIAKQIGVSSTVVSKYLRVNNLQVPKELHLQFIADKLKRPFTPEEDEFIHKYIKDKSTKWICKKLKRTNNYISKRAKELGYSDLLQQKFKASTYQKGDKPWNTGTKGVMKPNSGCFQKGNKPHNTKSDGEISIRHESHKTSKPYKYIRISEAKWELLQRFVWRKHQGEIPEGMLVVFKNGNTMNCDISNLELITKEENMNRNTIHNYPEEIVSTYRMIGVINRKLNNLTK